MSLSIEASSAARPVKTFIQEYRASIGLALNLSLVLAALFSQRHLYGSASGFALYLMGCALIFIATIGKVWCYAYNSGNRDRVVITTGPYSICRNPIYLFSILGSLGIGLVAESVVLPIMTLLVLLPFYFHVIRGEEAKLSWLHGMEYRDYLATQPLIWPRGPFNFGGRIEFDGQRLARKLPKIFGILMIIPLTRLVCLLAQTFDSSLIAVW